MAEHSWWWTTGTTNDGASTYTQADLSDIAKILAACFGFEGVAPNYLNGLKITGTASPVSMDTGGGLVDGKPYKNDAAATMVIPSPTTLTRIDRLVLRADWANHLVRLTRIAGTEGGGVPAITQTPGTTYDIKLFQASITTGGVITLTDERTLASLLTGRVGGSATDWTVQGSTAFLVPGFKMYSGSFQVVVTGNPTSGPVVNYPAAFANNPLILLTVSSGAGNGFVANIGVLNNTSQFQAVLTGLTTGTVTVFWMAIGL